MALHGTAVNMAFIAKRGRDLEVLVAISDVITISLSSLTSLK
jgi:hypothetical protein